MFNIDASFCILLECFVAGCRNRMNLGRNNKKNLLKVCIWGQKCDKPEQFWSLLS